MSMTSSSYLAKAIFPAPFSAPDSSSNDSGHPAPSGRAPARRELRVPPFPPAFLAFLGFVLLVAGGVGETPGSVDRVSLSLGLILAAVVWVALMLVAELYTATPERPEGL
jgi:hypothetical protein